MKHITLIITLLCGFALSTLAQDSQVSDEIVKNKTNTLYIISMNDGRELKARDLILGPSEIVQMDILSKDKIKQNYNDVKADMVIKIIPKAGVKLLNIKNVLDKFNVEQQYRSYKILNEGLEVNDPTQLLVSESLLQKVNVNKDKHYINIITTMYKNTLDARKKAKEDRERRMNEYKKARNN